MTSSSGSSWKGRSGNNVNVKNVDNVKKSVNVVASKTSYGYNKRPEPEPEL
jgi:hypothetical protein